MVYSRKLKRDVSRGEIALVNIRTLLIYSLSIAFSLGMNDLFIKLFSHFSYQNKIIAQVVYILLILGLIIFITVCYQVNISAGLI